MQLFSGPSYATLYWSTWNTHKSESKWGNAFDLCLKMRSLLTEFNALLDFTFLIEGYLYKWTFMENSHLDGLDMEGLFVTVFSSFGWCSQMNRYILNCFVISLLLGSMFSMVSWKRLSSILHTLIKYRFWAWCWDSKLASVSGSWTTARLSHRLTPSLFSLMFDFVPEKKRRKEEKKRSKKGMKIGRNQGFKNFRSFQAETSVIRPQMKWTPYLSLLYLWTSLCWTHSTLWAVW